MTEESHEEANGTAHLESVECVDLNADIERLVGWLRMRGFDTCDSGDGKTKVYECDRQYPYVSIKQSPTGLTMHADRLLFAMRELGVEAEAMGPDATTTAIQATYDPVNKVGILDLMVSFADLDKINAYFDRSE